MTPAPDQQQCSLLAKLTRESEWQSPLGSEDRHFAERNTILQLLLDSYGSLEYSHPNDVI